ncbi:MAG: hypothetical protein FWE74_02960 [Oscillospiraceae bacterium]|nr:hypothetical protein [Oscillospiraceae bacterium]
MIILKDNECLVYAGTIALRSPSGTPLPAVPQYMIVPADEADPAAIVELQKEKRLVLGGMIYTDIEEARKRFAAGERKLSTESGKQLYFVEDAANINKKTGLSKGEEKAIEPLLSDIVEAFGRDMRKIKALHKQGLAV